MFGSFAQLQVRRAYGLLALFALLTVAAAWLWAHEGHEALPARGATPVKDAKGEIVGVNLAPEALRALDVTVEEVTSGSLDTRLAAPATVVAPWNAHAFVVPRLGGRVASLLVKPGQLVAEGQPVVEIESLELADLLRELLDARTAVELATRNLAGLAASAERGSTPRADVREAAALQRQRVDALDLARSRLLGSGILADDIDRLLRGETSALRTLTIRSPIAGRVDHLDVTAGQVIEPATIIMEVIDSSRVWLRINVLEKDLHRIRPAQTVNVQIAGDPPRRSRIAVVGHYLDPHTRQADVWADLDNAEGRHRPGMTGNVEIVIPAARTGLLLPARALIAEGAERFVLVEVGPGQFRRQNVVVESIRQDQIQVAPDTGLFPGDRVVVAGSHELASFFPQGTLHLSDEAQRAIGLRVEAVRRRMLTKEIDLMATVDLPPAGRSVISSRLGGTIRHLAVNRDQEVRSGAVLAEVFSPEFINLQFELLRADSQVQLQTENLAWLKPVAGDSIPERTVREAEAALATARQRNDSLLRKLRELGLTDDQLRQLREKRQVVEALPVRARSAGQVVRVDAVLGQFIKPEQPLFEVHDYRNALLRISVPERQLTLVHPGMSGRVRLVADPNYAGEATIARLGQVVDSASRTAAAWAEFRSPPPLLPAGATAHVELVIGNEAALLAVPLEAVSRERSATFVFVQRADRAFERRAVQTGREDGRFVEILGGLAEGESIAVGGVAELQTAFAALR